MPDSTITLVGNLTRSPELRFTPGGVATAGFGMAVNRRFQKDGQWEEQTSFFDIVCYGSLAENVSDTLPQGARAVVTGRLEQRSWEDKEGGKRSKVEVVAEEVGPSLRWATAEVTRNERKDQNGTQRKPAASGARRPAPSRNDEPEGY